MNEVTKALAANLKRLRGRQGLTQAALSVRSGTRLPGISAIEHGKGNPTLSTLAALAEALNVSVSDLLREPKARV